jgi:hypothetical protein
MLPLNELCSEDISAETPLITVQHGSAFVGGAAPTGVALMGSIWNLCSLLGATALHW